MGTGHRELSKVGDQVLKFFRFPITSGTQILNFLWYPVLTFEIFSVTGPEWYRKFRNFVGYQKNLVKNKKVTVWVEPHRYEISVEPSPTLKEYFPFRDTSDRQARYIFGLSRQFWTKSAQMYFFIFFSENFLSRVLMKFVIPNFWTQKIIFFVQRK